jgi:hypothetical protein
MVQLGFSKFTLGISSPGGAAVFNPQSKHGIKMRQGTLPTSLGQLVHSYDKPPEILILPWRLGLALICLWITNVNTFTTLVTASKH